jgi:hypothetical protein
MFRKTYDHACDSMITDSGLCSVAVIDLKHRKHEVSQFDIEVIDNIDATCFTSCYMLHLQDCHRHNHHDHPSPTVMGHPT